MQKVPFLDLSYQNDPLHDEMAASLRGVIESGQFILGPEVEKFEAAFAEFCGVRHAVALNSGTSALHLGLLSLGVERGDEVITVAFSFAASVEAILYCGARPVYVDIDAGTLVMDVSKVEEAISERTKVILPVHLYGNPVDMGALKAIADRHGVPVLEDACQAHGALHRGKPVGGWGNAAAFSFYPTKNLGTLGEGGILTTDDGDLAETARALRNHGETSRYHNALVGHNYRMTAFQGAVLNVKLPYLDEWNSRRRGLAELYRNSLAGGQVPGLRVVEVTPESSAVYHQFVVMVEERERIMLGLEEDGIGTQVVYPVPLNRQPAFARHGVGETDLPVTENAAERVLSLPLYPGMQEDSVETVTAGLRRLLE